jgi:SRSO17 transposase
LQGSSAVMATLMGDLGVAAAALEAQRGALVEFAEEMYAPLARCDQRAKAQCYTRGLLIEGRRKSMQPMAERLGEVDDQGLQQFISDSPWDETAVRRRLARRMCGELAVEAWAIDDTGTPKCGRFSPGVARQYCGELGKVANCQVAVSINAVSDAASCPLGWRLFLPVEWDRDAERRARAKVPDDVEHRPKWQLALDMLDELKQWGLTPPVVVADAGYGEIGEFRAGLEQRELAYVVQVKGGTSAYRADEQPIRPAYRGRGRPPVARYHAKPSALRELALAAGREAAAARCNRTSSRCACVPPAADSTRPARSVPSAGCSASGPRAPTSRSSTGSPTCPPRPRSSASCCSASCAGASNTTTANSSNASA